MTTEVTVTAKHLTPGCKIAVTKVRFVPKEDGTFDHVKDPSTTKWLTEGESYTTHVWQDGYLAVTEVLELEPAE